MDELTGLMNHSFSLNDRDNTEYVTNLGKRLNTFVENMSNISLTLHREFLNEIETLFRTIQCHYIDNVDAEDEYGEHPRILLQFKYIREMIRNFLMTNGDKFSLKFKYQFAYHALIQLYFMAHEMGNSYLWEKTDIHDYDRPVTFYEYELNSLADSMKEL